MSFIGLRFMYYQ